MIIKKNYGEDYIIMKVTNIETSENGLFTILSGQLIDEKGCEEFREFEELSLHMNNNVEVIEA